MFVYSAPVSRKGGIGGPLAFGVDSAVVGDGVVVTGPNATGTIAFGIDSAVVGDGVVVTSPNAMSARLGLNLPESVAVYLCRRASRALKDLLACLDRLDEASLRQQRPITLPLAQKVLGLSAKLAAPVKQPPGIGA